MKKVKTKILLLVLSILLPIFVSGCLNPLQDVPVIKINMTFVDKQGIAEAENFAFAQGNVSYIDRPKRVQAESFPAISARVTTRRGNETSIGPWEVIPYKGSGDYSLNIGFPKDYHPEIGDSLHISIIVIDKDGQRIGYVIKDTIWQ